MKYHLILSDLDGVIRHYPKSRDERIESKYNLNPGTLFKAAFEHSHLEDAICGRISDEQWRLQTENNIASGYSSSIARKAVAEWSEFPGAVDHHFSNQLQNQFPDIPIALLTNGTTRLKEDLGKIGLTNRFFKVFNSAEIGACKPDPQIFEHVLADLNCAPLEILFIDDSKTNVEAAMRMGFSTHHFTSLESFAFLRSTPIEF